MKKIGSLFVGIMLLLVVAVTGVAIWQGRGENGESNQSIKTTEYGAFLAAQHAVYVNDFDAAASFGMALKNQSSPIVQHTKNITVFLSGRMPEGVSGLKKESGTAARLIYDAYLVANDKWEEVYSRHKNDKSALVAPLRIWSSVAINHRTEALKFVDSLETNDSWKSFVRGQIYAETGNISKATEAFDAVQAKFMNINDYLYVMSFYLHNNMSDKADLLRQDFSSQPSGMFMNNFDDIPDWSRYSGLKNELAFSLIQNVSHTKVMMYSDLAVLLLRFAQITSTEDESDGDAINYYLGHFFLNNGGDYESYFAKIKPDSPFYPFATMRIVEGEQDISKLRNVLRAYPTFVPAINKLVAYHIAHGNRRAALRIVNKAMDNEELSDEHHAFFLKSRAQIYFAFDDLILAQSDISAASDILTVDGEILALQTKIWVAQNREIETAYEYAMALIKRNPSDVFAWDVLGRVVAVREGDDAALELLSRVGEVANDCSALFETLGDLYMRTGNYKLAQDSYSRAIELSGDGLVVVPKIKQKLRKVK